MEGHVELPSGENQNMFGFWKSRLTDMLIESVKADDGIPAPALGIAAYFLPNIKE